ncbi:MAG: flagellar hook-length control protein FliK [Pseudomonadota bacterium]
MSVQTLADFIAPSPPVNQPPKTTRLVDDLDTQRRDPFGEILAEETKPASSEETASNNKTVQGNVDRQITQADSDVADRDAERPKVTLDDDGDSQNEPAEPVQAVDLLSDIVAPTGVTQVFAPLVVEGAIAAVNPVSAESIALSASQLGVQKSQTIGQPGEGFDFRGLISGDSEASGEAPSKQSQNGQTELSQLLKARSANGASSQGSQSQQTQSIAAQTNFSDLLNQSLTSVEGDTSQATGELTSINRTGGTGDALLTTDPTKATGRVPLTPEAIGARIVQAARNGETRFRIELDPPELGRIDVRLEIGSDGRANAVLSADRAETLDMLQRDIRVLERTLLQAGLQLERGSIEMGLRQQGDGDRNPGQGEANDKRTKDQRDGPEEAVETAVDERPVRLGHIGVDRRV